MRECFRRVLRDHEEYDTVKSVCWHVGCVLQCQTGKRATLAVQTLGELGFPHMTAVVMNLDDWWRNGNPFTK
jgi:hypothetical protein